MRDKVIFKTVSPNQNLFQKRKESRSGFEPRSLCLVTSLRGEGKPERGGGESERGEREREIR